MTQLNESGLSVIDAPSMVLDGVRYAAMPEQAFKKCAGCAFVENHTDCRRVRHVFGEACGEKRFIYVRAESPKPAERHITSTALALKLTMILDRSKRIAGESITSGAAAVLNAYTGALRTEFEHLLDDMREGE